jgi:hypothetical protein
MRQLIFIIFAFLSLNFAFAKKGDYSLVKLLTTEPYIFGVEVNYFIKSKPKVFRSDVFVKAKIQTSLKNPAQQEQIWIRFMKDDCTGIGSYDTTGVKYIICMVNKQSNDSVYENILQGAIQSFETYHDYIQWMNFYSDAYHWVSCKTAQKFSLKNSWIRKYLKNTNLHNRLLYEIQFFQKEYGLIDQETQLLIADYIINQWGTSHSLDGLGKLTRKNKKRVLNFLVEMIQKDDKINCSIMDLLWYYLDNSKLHHLWSEYCDSNNLLSDAEKLGLIQKFKSEIFK